MLLYLPSGVPIKPIMSGTTEAASERAATLLKFTQTQITTTPICSKNTHPTIKSPIRLYSLPESKNKAIHIHHLSRLNPSWHLPFQHQQSPVFSATSHTRKRMGTTRRASPIRERQRPSYQLRTAYSKVLIPPRVPLLIPIVHIFQRIHSFVAPDLEQRRSPVHIGRSQRYREKNFSNHIPSKSSQNA